MESIADKMSNREEIKRDIMRKIVKRIGGGIVEASPNLNEHISDDVVKNICVLTVFNCTHGRIPYLVALGMSIASAIDMETGSVDEMSKLLSLMEDFDRL